MWKNNSPVKDLDKFIESSFSPSQTLSNIEKAARHKLMVNKNNFVLSMTDKNLWRGWKQPHPKHQISTEMYCGKKNYKGNCPIKEIKYLLSNMEWYKIQHFLHHLENLKKIVLLANHLLLDITGFYLWQLFLWDII